MTDRTAYTLGLVLTTFLTNGILTTLFTGEQPEGEDFMAFRTGNTDENGFPERFMLPTYMKDMYAYWNDTTKTLGHKLHPAIGVIKDVAENRDYYGTEIRKEGDNIAEQFSQVLGYGVKQYVPFWMRGWQQETERGGDALTHVLPLMGVMPAPSEMNRTPAERETRKLIQSRMLNMSKTSAEFERSEKLRKLRKALRDNEPTALQQIQEAVSLGEISTRSAQMIQNESTMSPLAAGFRKLSFDEAQKIMEMATPAEQEELEPLFRAKEKNWKKLYPHGEAE